MTKEPQQIGYRWVIKRWFQNVQKWHFAAIDIDWKTWIDGKTISFPTREEAVAFLTENANCFEPDCEPTLMQRVPFPARFDS